MAGGFVEGAATRSHHVISNFDISEFSPSFDMEMRIEGDKTTPSGPQVHHLVLRSQGA